jgi:Lectin C-type domain
MCPDTERTRTAVSADSAEQLTRAAAPGKGGLRGRPRADNVLTSQCLDADGAPLVLHSHNGHLYSYVPTMTFESWHDAHLAASALSCCQAKGRLLVANDATERDFVKSSVVPKASSGWIGNVDEANDGVWKDELTAPAPAPAPASATAAATSSGDIDSLIPEGGNSDYAVDCGSDSNYDDKDHLYGVRCLQSAPLPIIVEFDCPEDVGTELPVSYQ